MKHRCDTWKDCGDSTCRHAKSHGECWRSRGPTRCSTANCLVRCNPTPTTKEKLETLFPTCSTCGAEEKDWAHSLGTLYGMKIVIDDGDACDERFQSNTVDLEGAVRDIIRDVVLDVTRETAGPLYIRDEATNRIMKLMELPF